MIYNPSFVIVSSHLVLITMSEVMHVRFSDNIESIAEIGWWYIVITLIVFSILAVIHIISMCFGVSTRKLMYARNSATLHDIDTWVSTLAFAPSASAIARAVDSV